MKHLIKSASIALALSASAAFAEAEHTLIISSWAPPTHGINAQMWPTFVDMVEEATDGKVTADLKLGIAPPPAQMDIVQDGAADLSIIFHGYQPGRFVTTKLIELPGYEGTAEAASVAYWRVYESHLKAADEHRGVKVIAMHTHGPAQLHTSSEISSLEDVSGLKVRIPGGVGGDVGSALGATGIQVPAPKVYETLASNAADGVVMPMESRKGFRLTEVAQNVFELPGGLYRGSFQKVFGEPLSRALGAIWDDIDAAGREATEGTAGNAIVPASANDVAEFQQLSEGIIANVLQEVDGKGVDANAAYTQVKTELAGQ